MTFVNSAPAPHATPSSSTCGAAPPRRPPRRLEIRPINAKRHPSAAHAAPGAAPPRPPPTRTRHRAARTRGAHGEPDAFRRAERRLPILARLDEPQKLRWQGQQAAQRPPGPLPRDENGERSLLQERAGIDADESYGSQEHALSSYLKLHPVLSLESTSCQTLQLVANLVEGTSIPTKELEIVPKPHDDEYLRCKLPRLNPPHSREGVPGGHALRTQFVIQSTFTSCNLTLATYPRAQATKRGDRRAAVLLWRPVHLRVAGALALRRRHRHGLHRHRVPAAVAGGRVQEVGQAAAHQGKCLVCSRYVTTYIYRCARADPTFKPSACIPLQAFGNSLGVEAGENVPTHSSVANDSDGYRQEALLFVDEQWADTAAARGGMASLLWRPCVKFDTRTTSTSRTTRVCRGCCSATWARRTSRRCAFLPAGRGSAASAPVGQRTATPPTRPSPPSPT